MSKVNPNTWLLGILIAILGVVAIDVGHRVVAPPKAAKTTPTDPKEIQKAFAPPFKVGDVAPEFTLPDDKGEKKALSQMVKGDTMLTFTCGCSSCRAMHTYMAKLLAKMGSKAPKVVTVTSMPPEGEAAWIRDTQLKQQFVFEPHDEKLREAEKKQYGGNIITDLYKGHPCPRLYRLNGERKVTWIGPSNNNLPPIEAGPIMGGELAKNLGFRYPGEKDDGRPVAPPMIPMP